MKKLKEKSMLLKTKSRKLVINNKEYKITKTQYKILVFLSDGENHFKRDLINYLWGDNEDSLLWAERNLMTHIFLLNKRVKDKIVTSKAWYRYKLMVPMYVIGE